MEDMVGKCFICGIEKIIVYLSFVFLSYSRLIRMDRDGLIILKKSTIYGIIFIIFIIWKIKKLQNKMVLNLIFMT